MEEYIESLTEEEQARLALTWENEDEHAFLRALPPPLNERQFPKEKRWVGENCYLAQLSNEVFYILKKRRKTLEVEAGMVLQIERKKVKLQVTVTSILTAGDPTRVCQPVQIELVEKML